MLRFESKRIAWICNFPAFLVKPKNENKDEEKKVSKWNAFNLVPDKEMYNERLGVQYTHKVICELVSNGSYDIFEKLYNEKYPSEVWEMLAIRKAVNY